MSRHGVKRPGGETDTRRSVHQRAHGLLGKNRPTRATTLADGNVAYVPLRHGATITRSARALQQLCDQIQESVGTFRSSRIYDSAPCWRGTGSNAGLGWIGKHTI